jgi:hypothetical protein
MNCALGVLYRTTIVSAMSTTKSMKSFQILDDGNKGLQQSGGWYIVTPIIKLKYLTTNHMFI